MYQQSAWTKVLIIIGIFIVASAVICVMGTKERVNEEVAPGEKPKDDVSALTAVKSLFMNRYWLTMVLRCRALYADQQCSVNLSVCNHVLHTVLYEEVRKTQNLSAWSDRHGSGIRRDRSLWAEYGSFDSV